jgi:Fe-S cluster assembly protein SufD
MPVTLNPFVAEAERLAGSRHADPAWLARVRRDALERFDQLGFPTTSDEEWRFTSVAPIADATFALAHGDAANLTRADLAPFEWDGRRAATLVFLNGEYAERLSDTAGLPAGVRVGSFARELRGSSAHVLEAHLARIGDGARHPFTSLNAAFLADGAFVEVPDNVVVAAPIHVVFLTSGPASATMAHPRLLAVLGRNSEATLVESYGAAGARGYFTNAVTEIAAGESATLRHYKIQREDTGSFHIGAMYIRARKDATVESHSIAFGGALVRNDVNVVLDGEGGHCTLNGLYMADGTQLVDNHTTIDHARAHCASREVYKGILGGHAKAVFNGKIVVRPDAQQTDAKQTNKALLLSEGAQINTKPQLEIFANDVKCTHGAAIGQIDDDAIFYLRARGIGETEARRMLVRAFAGDVVNQMPLAPLRARIDEELVQRLPESRS